MDRFEPVVVSSSLRLSLLSTSLATVSRPERFADNFAL